MKINNMRRKKTSHDQDIRQQLVDKCADEVLLAFEKEKEVEESVGRLIDFKRFKEYMSVLEEKDPLLSDYSEEAALSRLMEKINEVRTINEGAAEFNTPIPQKHDLRNVKRLIAMAAALMVMFISGSYALGAEWPKAILQWGEEILSISRGREPSGSLELGSQENPGASGDKEYLSLDEALKENGMDLPVPTWIPGEFHLDDIQVSRTEDKVVISAIYVDGVDKNFIINVVHDRENTVSNRMYEIDEGYRETYIVDNQEYYIASNISRYNAIWFEDLYECSISGHLTIEEIKTMIDSISEGVA